MKALLLSFTLFLSLVVVAQKPPSFQFRFLYGGKPLVLNDSTVYKTATGQAITISEVKFYIGSVLFLNKSNTVYHQNSYHLVDYSDTKSLSWTFDKAISQPYDEVDITIGVDSLATIAGVGKGDLDPTKGMYWTWNSGYINIKIEGRSMACPTPKHQFNFHLGGYQGESPAWTRARFPRTNKTSPMIFTIDLEHCFKSLDLSETHSIMEPSSKVRRVIYRFIDCIDFPKP